MTSMQNGSSEAMFAPSDVTPQMKRKIKGLPVSEQTWIAVSIKEHVVEGSIMQGSTFLVIRSMVVMGGSWKSRMEYR